ncbi:amidohydrolase family protein [Candidatus Bathyarchaeota archaeon]|nr:amidohydrolase family protein [Candidatus Bathyarchaeota archaeon]
MNFVGKYRIPWKIADEFPETKIIVAYFGKYLCRDEWLIDEFIHIAEVHENIFLDTSGVIIPRKIREAVDRLGSDRIIFGTDDPTPDGARFVLAEIDKIRSLNLNPKDEVAILGGTASKLLRI